MIMMTIIIMKNVIYEVPLHPPIQGLAALHEETTWQVMIVMVGDFFFWRLQ